MTIISEVAEGIYQIRPEGTCFERFPLCTVYLVVDDAVALVETGCAIQADDILQAIDKVLGDRNRVSYILPTHLHPDHAGAAGHLIQQLEKAKIVAHPDVAMALSDSSTIGRLMSGFELIFGKETKKVFGEMVPTPKERFFSIQYGERISLGKRELEALHTPGHDPNHLCFLDTKSRGLFCGDVMGGYFSEIDFIYPPYTPGTDLGLTLESIQRLHEVRPTKLFFSHGCAVEDGTKYIQMAADNLTRSQNAALEAIRAGSDMGRTAHAIIESLANDSEAIRVELSRYTQIALTAAGACRWYFKKNAMI